MTIHSSPTFSRANFESAIDMLHRYGESFRVPLLEAARDGLIDLAFLVQPNASAPIGKIRGSRRPMVAVICADQGRPSPHTEWRCAKALTQWAPSAIVHACAALPAHYAHAVAWALKYGGCLVVETGSAAAEGWTELLRPDVPALIIMPTSGVHPVPGAVH
jgi:hypothetical protein